MRLIAAIVGAASLLIAATRWLRVSQREHYIGGSCSATLWRWVRVRPPNSTLVVVTALALALGLAVDGRLGETGALVAAILAALVPFPMTVLGKERRLRFTRRAVTLGVVELLLGAVVILIALVADRWYVGPALAAAFMFFLADVAARLLSPIEARMLQKYRRQAEARLRQVNPTVIAVTGSWGKTSTKGHIRDLLSGSVNVVASPASFNNAAGLSRAINEGLRADAEVFVAEMGMYGPGEIRELCTWIRPDIAVITGIGPVHLERVGSIEGIVAAKAEILERASQAVLWIESPSLAELASSLSGIRVWRVGFDTNPDAEVSVRIRDDRIEIIFHGECLGECANTDGLHASNVACAVATALAFGVEPRSLSPRVRSLSGSAHRGVAVQDARGVWVIDDTFNSNPAGAVRGLESLTRLSPHGTRVVVTPGMVELGRRQTAENTAFAEAATAAGDRVVIVGWTNRKALLAGASTAVLVRDRDEARDWVRNNLAPADAVLWENDLPDHYP